MIYGSVCSGIEAATAAWHPMGWKPAFFSEIEKYPRHVLQHHYPEVPLHGDFTTIDENSYGAIDLLVGGTPCQPFSVLGQRKGHEDDRHLWPEMLRVITQARPTWVVAENVTGHITMGLDAVISDLESAGYTTRPVVIPAGAVGARHLRDRVWLISHASSERRQQKPRRTPGNEEAHEGRRADADNKPCGMAKALRGADWWAAEPAVHKLANGLPTGLVRDMNRALGNAIVPQVAYQILRCLGAH